MNLLGVSLLFSIAFMAKAEVGDTTLVSAHTRVNMVWNEGYEELVSFPTDGKKYRKIMMYFKLGCASSGCSDWDYTVRIDAKKANSPGDTALYELGRLITPYGGYMARSQNGFNNKWNITHAYDVTDFAPILKGDVPLRVFYDGWSSGFSATIWFEMIEGTPVREVLGVENIYRVSESYKTSDEFEKKALPEKTAKLAPGAVDARVKVLVTGHGFDNSNNCAEFCERNYALKVNGQGVTKVKMWRNDCGSNPIFPQGGTWIYNRANWCPGDKVEVYDHELKDYIKTDGDNLIDLSIDKYTWTGTQAPYYILSSVLVSYGKINFANDAAMESIITPNQNSNVRFNSVCANPIIKIRNNGSNLLKRLKIEYGVKGSNQTCVYSWSGSLAFNETAEVTLPNTNLGIWPDTENIFWVRLSEPNEATEEYNADNSMMTPFKTTPLMEAGMNFFIRSNNKFTENSLEIMNLSTGETVVSVAKMANEVYDIPLSFPKGCYRLLIKDKNGDGFYWPFNGAAGRGYIQLRKDGNPVKTFNPDFGNEFVYDFTLDYVQGRTAAPAPTLLVSEGGKELNSGNELYFGIMEVGKPITRTIRLENKGNSTLHLVKTEINDKRFTFSKKVPMSLEAGAFFETDITFNSGEEKDAKARLVFTSNDYLLNTFELDLNVLTKITNLVPLSEQDFAVYPNPAQDAVRIELRTTQAHGQIILANLLGQEVIAPLKTIGTNSYILDMSQLANGVYLLKWQNDNRMAVRKIVKQD